MGFANNGKMKSYKRTVAEIKDKFDIDVVAGENRLEIMLGYNEVMPTAMRDFVEFFLHKELSIYSSETLKSAKIGRIIVARRMAMEGERVCGVAQMSIWKLPWQRNAIYLDTKRFSGSYSRRVVHHEIFHAIDYHDDFSRYRDSKWTKLNEPGFKYTKAPYEHNPVIPPGFLSAYGATKVYEDKAEFFSYMLVCYSHVERQAHSDPVIKAKMARMKELLYTYCHDFNDSFWEKRAAASIPAF